MCETADTPGPRVRMTDYMSSLRKVDRYVPLKTKYEENRVKNFPPLNPTLQPDLQQGDIDQIDLQNSLEDFDLNILPKPPLEQSEEQVRQLQAQVEALNGQLHEAQLKSKSVTELSLQARQQKNNLSVVKETSERRIAEFLNSPHPTSWESEECKLLLIHYTSCLDMSNFTLDPETNKFKPTKDDFLEVFRKQCTLEEQEEREARLETMKTAALDALNLFEPRRRLRKQSMRGRSNSVKRDREEEKDAASSTLSKQRTTSPPPTSAPPS